ncbi:MAG: serine protease [Candidatus Moranbacteria bacterium]|jgi:S1-C subfamily serine protease|nr:serine protease [Candidatus Moranbacteria bacterium]
MATTILKKALSLVFLAVLVLVLGGIGGVFFERFVIPRLAASSSFGQMDFFKKATETVTVINKTEQIVIREDDTVEKIVSQPATAVVNIVALPEAKESKGNTTLLGAAAETVATTTGVLLTNDGLVVTYSEVPFDTEKTHYSILLFDGSIHQATFAGRDTLTNLSFFRVSDAANTPAIAFANSDDARVGKKLIAIGNTFAEYQNRLAVGLLGNINRIYNLSGKTVASSEKWEGVFEMDPSKAEAFVGGPVIGFNGEMVGIVGTLSVNNALQSFVIPANVVHDALNRLISGTLSDRPMLGVYYLSITKALALGRGLPRDRGALIYSRSGTTGLALIADSPAMKAGLLAGDIITSVNGIEVNLDNPLSALVAQANKGDTLQLIVLRNGEEKTISVKL